MTLSAAERPFYIAGGSLPIDAASYVRRRADEDLFNSLLAGEFCYILSSRQMGKSSLMIRTVSRLQERRVHTAVVDLTSLGQNLNPEQWYRGMLSRAGAQLHLEDELDDFWYDHEALPPLERWISGLQKVVLGKLAGPVVFFVDEIDMVRSLPFATGEFFAGLRSCYNRRNSEPEVARLTFCLLGLASPSELIQDVNVTPFNIGRRIELHDFEPVEASALAEGLYNGGRNGASLLQRALHWTSGHPYLTQRLCVTIAERPGVQTESDVDTLCDGLFFSHESTRSESNLAFVSNRILQGGGDVAGLLELYQRVYSGGQVRDDPSSPLCDALTTAGIVRKSAGLLTVRNRIYRRVFDARWIRANMPDAELRRQVTARRKGFLQGGLLFGAIAAVIAYLGFARDTEAGLANNYLYVADMNLAQRAWESSPIQVENVKRLLDETRSNKYRGWVWGYWNRLCHLDLHTFRSVHGPVTCIAISPNGTRVATGHADGAAVVWDANGGPDTLTLHGKLGEAADVSFAPDGNQLELVSRDSATVAWDVATGQEKRRATHSSHPAARYVLSSASPSSRGTAVFAAIGVVDARTGLPIGIIRGDRSNIKCIAVSRDGGRIVTGNRDNTAVVYDGKTGERLFSLKGHAKAINAVAFFPDGTRIATGSDDGTAKIWAAVAGQDEVVISNGSRHITSVAYSPNGQRVVVCGDGVRVLDGSSGRELAAPEMSEGIVQAAFSPHGERIAGIGKGGTVIIWDSRTGQHKQTLPSPAGGETRAICIAYSPDGSRIATGMKDNTVTVRDAATGNVLITLNGHMGAVESVAFSPDGRSLATGSDDNTARVWDASTGTERVKITEHTENVLSVAFSPDGGRVITGGADSIIGVWDARTGERYLWLQGHSGPVRSVQYSMNGTRLLTGSEDKTVKVWNSQFGKEILTLKGFKGAVSSAVFSPQYDRIAAGSLDGTTRIWFADNSDLETARTTIERK
jgi:WD40 repeat protein